MLCTMKELLEQAARRNAAVGAFSAYTMEAVKGIVQAAEQTQTPVILQIAESRFPYAPFELMGPMMVNAAKKASVPVAVHLDHGQHLETVQRALELGFTSVMIDGSTKPIEENAALTQSVVNVAKYFDVPVEAEIGELQRLDNGVVQENKNVADPEQVRRFLELCSPDTLAIGIGNAHGYYKGKPDIKLEVLREVRKFTDIPLVLHGCTGMDESIVKEAIGLGVAKINFGTEIRYKYVQHYEEALRELDHQGHSWKLSQYASNALCEDVKKIIRLSGSEGKA